jgi:hypothetical protein
VLHREWLDLETDDAREVGGGVAVVEDGEAQVVVEEEGYLLLALFFLDVRDGARGR